METTLNNANYSKIDKVAKRRSIVLGILLRKWGSFGFFVLTMIFFSVVDNQYLTISNISNMTYESIVPTVISIGLTIVIIAGSFDLSIAAVASFGGMIVAIVLPHVGTATACIIGLGAGSAIGLVNGVLIGVLGISGLTVTLGMQFIITAIEIWISGGFENAIPLGFSGFLAFGQGSIGQFKIMIGAFLLLAIIAYIFIYKTSWGIKISALGDNSLAAFFSGLNIRFFVILSFILSAAFCTVGGIMIVAMNGTHIPTVGKWYLLDAFTIAYLGSTMFKEGKPNILGTVIAGIMLSALITGMVMMGIRYEWKIFIKGIVLIAAVVLSAMLRHEEVHTQFL